MKNQQNIIDEQRVKPVDEKPKMREIVIQTDGANINISKNECSPLEFEAILIKILNKINQK